MKPARHPLDLDQPDGLSELPNPDSEQDAVGSGPESWTAGDLTLVERHPMFEGVAWETLEPLLRRCRIRELQVGEVLLTPDQINRHLHLLLDGQLKVYLDRLGSEEGFLIEPGECTGEISVIDCRPVTAFVAATRPSRMLFVPEKALWEDLLATPPIAKGFMRLFADRLRARTVVIQQALEQKLRYEHLQRELGIARDIQLGMLPRHLDLGPEIDIAAGMTPAQEVGGDFYDVFPVGSDEYCITIGDVSGKGVPAALFMVRTMTLLRSELLIDQPIEDALRNVNLRLCSENPTWMFATLVVALVNKRTGAVRYLNAGHDPILFGGEGLAYRSLPPPRGILVGVSEDAEYGVASLALRPNDVLVLYTDGITEAMNPDHELFRSDRLLACLSERRAASAQELADRINRAVEGFVAGAPQSDDLTWLILRYQGT
jgi:sigma-B regulation protein RsbU (phosphoserine phosphatase)